jgi:hypothetical protein
MHRKAILAFAVLIFGTGTAWPAQSDPAVCLNIRSMACRSWLDSNVRLNDIQVVGTADSYKQRPSEGMLSLIRFGGNRKDAEALDYAHPPIVDQLSAGARSLDFAVAYDPEGGLFKNPAGASMAMDLVDSNYVKTMSQPGFKVIHVLDVDYRSSCVTLIDCLGQIATWSRTHKKHIPLIVTLHTNDARTPMPGAVHPLPFDAAAMDALDAQIRSVFVANELITPDQVQGQYATLREAVLAHNWPKLGAARGKIIFVLDEDAQKTALYQGARHNLEGRALFVTAPEASTLAAFISIDDPRKEATRITAAVKNGFIVKTRADADSVEARENDTSRRDQAFASGAQIVDTDFIIPDSKIGAYHVTLADNPRAACDMRSAAVKCASWVMLPHDASAVPKPATPVAVPVSASITVTAKN